MDLGKLVPGGLKCPHDRPAVTARLAQRLVHSRCLMNVESMHIIRVLTYLRSEGKLVL